MTGLIPGIKSFIHKCYVKIDERVWMRGVEWRWRVTWMQGINMCRKDESLKHREELSAKWEKEKETWNDANIQLGVSEYRKSLVLWLMLAGVQSKLFVQGDSVHSHRHTQTHKYAYHLTLIYCKSSVFWYRPAGQAEIHHDFLASSSVSPAPRRSDERLTGSLLNTL